MGRLLAGSGRRRAPGRRGRRRVSARQFHVPKQRDHVVAETLVVIREVVIPLRYQLALLQIIKKSLQLSIDKLLAAWQHCMSILFFARIHRVRKENRHAVPFFVWAIRE